MPRLLLTSLFCCVCAFADSKVESELRRQLAASEAARVAETKRLSAQLATLALQNRIASNTSVASQKNAASTANSNAVTTNATLKENGRIAREQADKEFQQADEAHRQAADALEIAQIGVEQAREAAYKNAWEFAGVLLVILSSMTLSRFQHFKVQKRGFIYLTTLLL